MALPAQQIGPYELHEEICADGGVKLYFATDTRSLEQHLLYLLAPIAQLAIAQPDEVTVHPYFVSVQSAMQLRHRNLLAFQEHGQVDGHYYAVTEPLAGKSLNQLLQQQPTAFSAAEISRIVQEVATVLDFAAVQGITHQALTPDEIWLSQDGRLLVSGFGLPRSVAGQWPADAVLDEATPADSLALTPFTAPEQVQGDRPGDHRTDVYRLCAIAFTLLVGRPPFDPDDPSDLREQIVHQPPLAPDLVRPDMPAAVAAVLRFGLAKDPEARYANAGEFAQRLRLAQGTDGSVAPAEPAAPPAPKRRIFPPPRRSRSLRGPLLVYPLVLIIVLAGLLFAGKPFGRVFSSQNRALAPTAASPVQLAASQVNAVTATLRPRATATPVSATAEPPMVADTAPSATVTAAARPPTVEAPTLASSTQTGVTGERGDSPPAAPVTREQASVVDPASAARTGDLVRTLFDHLILTSRPPLPTTVDGNRIPPVADLPTSAAPPTTTAQVDAQADPTRVALAKPQAPAASSALAAQVETTATVPSQANLYLPLVVQSIYIEGDLNQNANLRSGPATSFPVLRVAQAGQRYLLIGCNVDCTWYQLQSGEWVAAFLVSNVADPLQTLPRTSVAAAPES